MQADGGKKPSGGKLGGVKERVHREEKERWKSGGKRERNEKSRLSGFDSRIYIISGFLEKKLRFLFFELYFDLKLFRVYNYASIIK